MGKADKEEVGVYIDGAKYLIALSIAHCDWVVYAVNTGYKSMGTGCSLSLHDGKKQLHSVSPLSASAHRENARYARLPIQPCLHLRRRFPKIYLWLFFFRTKFDSWPHAAASSLSQPSSLSVSQVLRQYEEARGRHLIFSQPVSSSNPAGPVPA